MQIRKKKGPKVDPCGRSWKLYKVLVEMKSKTEEKVELE